jgi:HD-GYP domain-containing protein (c-di-GMP phosphodiesterase class II)
VRSSIGVACYPMDGEEDEALLIVADRAMYAAKAAGGGQTRIASRLTERESNADSSRQLRFGMLETLANRMAVSAGRSAGEMQVLATATAGAAWVIGERLALGDAEQQMLRVAALSHAIGVTPDDDPRGSRIDLGLDDEMASLYTQIGKVFIAGSPGLDDAVRVIARHHHAPDELGEAPHDTLARILAVSERYAELTTGDQPMCGDDAVEHMRDDDMLDQATVQALHEGLHAPAVWRAA